MNKSSKDLRLVFQRMNKAGLSAVEIADAIGKTRQTVYNWRKIDDVKLFIEPEKNTRKPSIDLVEFKKYIEDNPFVFNRELAKRFNCGLKTAHKWRHRLGFKRKKAKTTYRESNEELKKTSKTT